MSHPSKRKGDKAELEAARILAEHLGLPIRRKLGAGRTDDEGDLEERLESLLTDPLPERTALQEAARRFAWDQVAPDWDHAIERLASGEFARVQDGPAH